MTPSELRTLRVMHNMLLRLSSGAARDELCVAWQQLLDEHTSLLDPNECRAIASGTAAPGGVCTSMRARTGLGANDARQYVEKCSALLGPLVSQ